MAIERLRRGASVLLRVKDRALLVTPAESVTSARLDRLRRLGAGCIDVALDEEVANAAGLTPAEAGDSPVTRMISVDLRSVDRNGSTAALALTVRALCSKYTSPSQFVLSGRVFPIRVASGGVLTNPNSVEAAAVDLVRSAGMSPAAVVTAVPHGYHGKHTVVLADILRYRMAVAGHGALSGWVDMPTPVGKFRARAVHVRYLYEDALVLAAGRVHDLDVDVPIYVHFECLLGDVFFSSLCTCKYQLEQAMREVYTAHTGLVLYVKTVDRLHVTWPTDRSRGEHRIDRDSPMAARLPSELEDAALSGLIDGIAADFGVGKPVLIWRRCALTRTNGVLATTTVTPCI